MPPRLAAYICYSEFNDHKPSTIEEFRTNLGKFQQKRVVYLCAVLNCLVQTWQGSKMDYEAQEFLIQSAFPPQLGDQLASLTRRSNTARALFHRGQLLFVAKEALLHCGEAGVDPLTTAYWRGLGLVFLMANDHLHFRFPPPDSTEERILNNLAQFIPIVENSAWHNYQSKLVRSFSMLNTYARQFPEHADYVDIQSMFQAKTGLSTNEYQALCFGALTRYAEMDLQGFKKNPADFLLPQTWFRDTAIPATKVESFWREVAADAAELRVKFQGRNFGNNDFTYFRDKPLFLDGESCYPLDPLFLAEKTDSGVFWRVHNSLNTDEEKKRLHRFWGVVFQAYANALLSESVDKKQNSFIPTPSYDSDGNEVCDAFIFCGSSLIIFEHKGSTFTAEAKYSGRRELLEAEIEEKLVHPRGVRQLANAIDRLFKPALREIVRGVDLGKVRTVYPVLVTRDDLGGTPLINALLNWKFRRVLRERSVRVTPLFCLSVEDLEYASGYLRDARLDDILDARYRGDTKLMSTFRAVDNPVLEALGEKRSEFVQNGIDEFTESMRCVLFTKRESAP